MSGPWIQSAVLDDGVDSITIDGGAQASVQLTISLVRGDWQGAIALQVQVYDPAGEPIAAVEVEGDPPAIPYATSRITVPIELAPTQPGVYWFDVRNADDLMTRVPLRIDWR